MNEIKKWSLECRAKDAVEVLNKRKFDAHYADTAEDAKKMVEKMLPEGAEIAVGGSVTLQKTVILDLIKSPKYKFIDRFTNKSWE